MSDALPSPWLIVPAAALLALGGLLALVGALGLLRMRDFYSRMHPPTLGSTLGTGCVLVASVLASLAQGEFTVLRQLLIGVFLTMTAPVTAILLMRAARRRNRDGG